MSSNTPWEQQEELGSFRAVIQNEINEAEGNSKFSVALKVPKEAVWDLQELDLSPKYCF